MIKYQVHVGYVAEEGRVILPGIYTDNQINLTEARSKSVVTVLNPSPLPEKSKTNTFVVGDIKTKVIEPTLSVTEDKIKQTKLEPTIIENTVDKDSGLQINLDTLENISKLKYIGQKTAQVVLDTRKEKPFVDYMDLNDRVPLKMKRKWEDIAIISFETNEPKVTNHLIEYI